jgi:hypothetical protein
MGLQVLALAGKYKLFRGGTEFPWGFKPNYSIAITIPHGMEVVVRSFLIDCGLLNAKR